MHLAHSIIIIFYSSITVLTVERRKQSSPSLIPSVHQRIGDPPLDFDHHIKFPNEDDHSENYGQCVRLSNLFPFAIIVRTIIKTIERIVFEAARVEKGPKSYPARVKTIPRQRVFYNGWNHESLTEFVSGWSNSSQHILSIQSCP
jgi:hypothetical protein